MMCANRYEAVSPFRGENLWNLRKWGMFWVPTALFSNKMEGGEGQTNQDLANSYPCRIFELIYTEQTNKIVGVFYWQREKKLH